MIAVFWDARWDMEHQPRVLKCCLPSARALVCSPLSSLQSSDVNAAQRWHGIPGEVSSHGATLLIVGSPSRATKYVFLIFARQHADGHLFPVPATRLLPASQACDQKGAACNSAMTSWAALLGLIDFRVSNLFKSSPFEDTQVKGRKSVHWLSLVSFFVVCHGLMMGFNEYPAGS